LNGKLIRTLIAHREYANARFSPDGRLPLTWTEDPDGDVAVRLWSAAGELLDSLSRERVRADWFSDNGLWIEATPQRPQEPKKLTWSLDSITCSALTVTACGCIWRIRQLTRISASAASDSALAVFSVSTFVPV
jgi:hypothetical protein